MKMIARFMVPALLVPLLMAAAPFGAPAYAATSITFGPELGQEGSFAYEGLKGVANSGDVEAILTLTLLSKTATSFTFGYEVANETGGAFTSARLMGFGFDLDRDYSAASVTGKFTKDNAGNVPGFGHTDLCLMAGGNGNSCAANAPGGVVIGGTDGIGQFVLNFAAPVAAITIDNSFVRWQSVTSSSLGLSNSSGVSQGVVMEAPTAAVPEVSMWVMMISGFGFVGMAMRRNAARVKPVLQ